MCLNGDGNETGKRKQLKPWEGESKIFEVGGLKTLNQIMPLFKLKSKGTSKQKIQTNKNTSSNSFHFFM